MNLKSKQKKQKNRNCIIKVQRKKSKTIAAASSRPVRNKNSVLDTKYDLPQLQRTAKQLSSTVRVQQATMNSYNT